MASESTMIEANDAIECEKIQHSLEESNLVSDDAIKIIMDLVRSMYEGQYKYEFLQEIPYDENHTYLLNMNVRIRSPHGAILSTFSYKGEVDVIRSQFAFGYRFTLTFTERGTYHEFYGRIYAFIGHLHIARSLDDVLIYFAPNNFVGN